jgi:hypothetical protein
MSNKFRNKNGSLSLYAFACGYVETKPLATAGGEARLYRDGAAWQVQARDDSRGRFLWESFDKLTPARSFFSKVQA